MPLDTEVDLGPGHIVFDGAQLPPERGTADPPSLRPKFIVAKRSPISATTELLLYNRKINMTFEAKIKTTYKEVTENSDASSKNLKLELKKTHHDVVDASSKSLIVSRKSSTRSTSDSNVAVIFTHFISLKIQMQSYSVDIYYSKFAAQAHKAIFCSIS